MFNFSSAIQTAENWIATSASHLLTLVASAEQSIHNLEASDPLVQTAVNLAASELEKVPVVGAIEPILLAVLHSAQALATVASTAAAAAPVAPVTPADPQASTAAGDDGVHRG